MTRKRQSDGDTLEKLLVQACHQAASRAWVKDHPGHTTDDFNHWEAPPPQRSKPSIGKHGWPIGLLGRRGVGRDSNRISKTIASIRGWVLTAIDPSTQKITTITAKDEAEADKFVAANNGKRNLYYSVNPTRTQKAAKKDIAAVEYLLADLDPADNETPEQAKARYLGQLDNGFKPQPTAIVDSGNGIQCLWRLAQPMVLGVPVGNEYAPDDQVKIADVEARVAAVMVRLGAKAGTQNIDRILRLPGTTNLPNAKKQKQGRVACPTEMLSFNGATHTLDAFALPTANEELNRPGTPADGGQHARQPEQERTPVDIDALPVSDRIKDLIRGIDDPAHVYGSRSERVMAVLMAMVGAKCTDDQMADVMLDKTLPNRRARA